MLTELISKVYEAFNMSKYVECPNEGGHPNKDKPLPSKCAKFDRHNDAFN